MNRPRPKGWQLSGTMFFLMMVTLVTIQTGHASSGWGHLGQSIFLMSVEMPGKALVYKAIVGDELFAKLTCETGPNAYHFDFDNLNKFQNAFLAGAVGPDTYDIKYFLGIGWPIHSKYPQRALNYINDLAAKEKGDDFLAARAFFFGWSFHYIADLVVHPGMNQASSLRVGREYAVHGPQHAIFEGLVDRISIYYWFLKNPKLGILPSRVIAKAGKGREIGSVIREIPNHWDQWKDDVKVTLKEFGQVFKGVFSEDRKTMSQAIKESKEKIRLLRETLYDKSLKVFFSDGIPEADIINGKAKLSDYIPAEWETGLSQTTSSANPYVKADVSEGIRWWKEIMSNAPAGFRHAVSKDGFACSLDYGREKPTPEPELDHRAVSSIQKIFNSALGR